MTKAAHRSPDVAQEAASARRMRRADATIANILAATEEIVLREGVERISIMDVCEHAKISRGTFYRYFSSQDDLLDAFSRHKRERFHNSMLEATAPYDDPDLKFRALLRYLKHYIDHGQARLLLRAAPEYTLRFFARIFNDSQVRIRDILDGVFAAWDKRLGIRIDRELVCEILIRYVLSEQLVPHERSDDGVERIERLILSLVSLPSVSKADKEIGGAPVRQVSQ